MAVLRCAIRCGFMKSEISRWGSVRFSDNRNPSVRFDAVIYPTGRFGVVFRIVNPTVRLGAVFTCRRCGSVNIFYVRRCGSVRFPTFKYLPGTVQCGAAMKSEKILRCGAVRLTAPSRWEKLHHKEPCKAVHASTTTVRVIRSNNTSPTSK